MTVLIKLIFKFFYKVIFDIFSSKLHLQVYFKELKPIFSEFKIFCFVFFFMKNGFVWSDFRVTDNFKLSGF